MTSSFIARQKLVHKLGSSLRLDWNTSIEHRCPLAVTGGNATTPGGLNATKFPSILKYDYFTPLEQTPKKKKQDDATEWIWTCICRNTTISHSSSEEDPHQSLCKHLPIQNQRKHLNSHFQGFKKYQKLERLQIN